jgi:hypothetical protein
MGKVGGDISATPSLGSRLLAALLRRRLALKEGMLVRAFGCNHSEQTFAILIRSGGEEQLVLIPVRWTSRSELKRPQAMDRDVLSVWKLEDTEKLAGFPIERIDVPIIHIANQQSVAEATEVFGRQSCSPWRFQGPSWPVCREAAEKLTTGIKDIDRSTSIRYQGAKGNV